MTRKQLDLHTGAVDGALLTAPGSTGADTVVSSSGTIEYDSDDTNRTQFGEPFALKVTPGSASGANYLAITTGLNSASLSMVGAFDIAKAPTADTQLLWAGIGTTRGFAAGLNSLGKFRLWSGGTFTGIWTSTMTASINTAYRIAVFATPGASTGTAKIAIYAGNSATPLEQSGLLSNVNMGTGNFTQVRWGKPTAGVGDPTSTFEMMYLAYDDAATDLYPPAVLAPALTATAASSIGTSVVSAGSASGIGSVASSIGTNVVSSGSASVGGSAASSIGTDVVSSGSASVVGSASSSSGVAVGPGSAVGANGAVIIPGSTYFGTTKIGSLFYGTTPISVLYQGSTKVFG